MNRNLLSLTALLVLLSCKGGKPAADDRVFGSLGASFSSTDSGSNSEDAVVEPSDSIVVDKDVDGGTIDNIGKAGGKGPDVPADSGKGPNTPDQNSGKGPTIPDPMKDKLAKCYPQWDKGAAGANYDIRQVTVDVEKLKSSNIQLTGDKPEVVFINMTTTGKIEKVKLSLENSKGLYCIDVTADKGIEHLDIDYVCGAKIGLIDIDGGKTKKVNVKEICKDKSKDHSDS